LKLNFSGKGLLLSFLICDAPTHGKQYHDGVNDWKADSTPEFHLESQLVKYRKLNEESFFTCLKIESITTKMFAVMKEVFPGLIVTDRKSPSQFLSTLSSSISETIHTSHLTKDMSQSVKPKPLGLSSLKGKTEPVDISGKMVTYRLPAVP